MHKNDGRFLSAVLAVATPVVLWLGIEYLNQPAGPGAAKQAVSAPMRAAQSAAGMDTPDAVTIPAPAAQPAPPVFVPVMYKCTQHGKTIYTDKPQDDCDHGTAWVGIASVPARTGMAPAKPYQQQLTELEQHMAEEARNAPPVVRPSSAQVDEHAARCRDIDAQIRWVDSALRAPHDGFWGDKLNADRRRLNDQRYAERC